MFRRKPRAPKRRHIRKLRLASLTLVLLALGAAAFTFGLLRAVASQIPELNPARLNREPQANTYVYANDGKTILAVLRGSQARVILPSSEISPWLKHSIVAIEDKRFYEHHGVDLHAIVRAAWNDLVGRPVQGGSTITQQFVKNALNGNAPTIGRKLREAALAWQVEQHWTKDQILTAYLNTVYFGNGAYGVQQACKVYFDESATKVTLSQAALLAGIPEDPSQWDPVAHPVHARARRNLVLKQLELQGYISPKQFAHASKAPMPKPQDVTLPATQSAAAPYFANYVTDQLVQHYGTRGVFGGNLHVKTTIDLGLQKLAREAVAKELPESIGPTAALVALDPRTGAVLAMIGGRNYHKSQFNLATQGERQPGSAFKPFVLAAALKAGIAPSTTLDSKPVSIFIGNKLWNVTNFEDEYQGPIDLTKALAVSDNSVFAQLTSVVGPPAVAEIAKVMGITTPLQPYFSIGLGAEPATPLEMARAYSTLADGGFRLDDALNGNEPHVVDCISVGTGNCKSNAETPRAVLDPNLTAVEVQMLRGVIQSGTGTSAQLSGGYDEAGKTGTTSNYGDAWFVGFTPDLVTAVWVGYPNSLQPMTYQYHGGPVVGGSYPALIWKAFMQKALAYEHDAPVQFPDGSVPYSVPATVTFRNSRLEQDNGNCHYTENVELFASVRLPIASCKKNEVSVPNVRGLLLAKAKARLLEQPLLTRVVWTKASPGTKLGVVLRQQPATGTLSAYQRVELFVARGNGRLKNGEPAKP
ncbi:MAG TPA: PBP1A family penicillin-binding protein [Gaiellaceae bacterium]